jgi:hypothetical protein
MKEKTKQPVFSFDDRAFESVEKMGRQGRFNQPCRHPGGCFPAPVATGYKEVAVTNPETGESRVIIIPTYD